MIRAIKRESGSSRSATCTERVSKEIQEKRGAYTTPACFKYKKANERNESKITPEPRSSIAFLDKQKEKRAIKRADIRGRSVAIVRSTSMSAT
jgi:hypothetical protein